MELLQSACLRSQRKGALSGLFLHPAAPLALVTTYWNPQVSL